LIIKKGNTMARKAQRAGNNSASHASQVFQGAGAVPPIPNGFPQDDLDYNEVWLAFTRARVVADWLPSDLIVLARIVQLEIDIRMLDKQRREEGFIILNEKGTTQIENPANRVIDTLTRQQLAMIRSLSLTAGAVGIAEARTAAKNDIKAKSDKDDLSDSLLAH
jgi:hypothetical protein